MTFLLVLGLVFGFFLVLGLTFLGVVFYFYVKALEEAYLDGWDMPS
jgi:hypothetical protein